MRIFPKKAYRFDHPAKQEEPVYVQALSFADVPEWVKDSSMFKLAKGAGELSVTEDKKQEKAAEEDAHDKTVKELQAEAKKLEIEGYSKMNKEELEKALEKAHSEAGE